MALDRIPESVRVAIHAELDAETPSYREEVADGEWTEPNHDDGDTGSER
ncbi:hypothetical protein [Microbacterium hominis]|uniref:Uncharacterized protein n=1 Tax=Microbacterium hominis TaxID=162426 RepID=A0A7D4TH91_9MICO|nr:hypothetical protein [Microbacterium hominis]QKJ19921.1 hypothetical protein HQM25_11510 [Microbacterium hominis]